MSIVNQTKHICDAYELETYKKVKIKVVHLYSA